MEKLAGPVLQIELCGVHPQDEAPGVEERDKDRRRTSPEGKGRQENRMGYKHVVEANFTKAVTMCTHCQALLRTLRRNIIPEHMCLLR